jgi:DNA-binding response OmpR family regulator
MSSRILVINDDQSILDLFDLLLKDEGYEVLLSQVDYEDVKDIEQLRPALIILDFGVPPKSPDHSDVNTARILTQTHQEARSPTMSGDVWH